MLHIITWQSQLIFPDHSSTFNLFKLMCIVIFSSALYFFFLGDKMLSCVLSKALCAFANKYLISGSPCSHWISFLCLYYGSFIPNMHKNCIFKRESSCKMSLAELFPLLVLHFLLNLGTTAGDFLLLFKIFIAV